MSMIDNTGYFFPTHKRYFFRMLRSEVIVVEVMNRNRVKMFKCLWGNITFLNRSDTESVEKGILNFCSKILNGKNGFIMGESTWNLHPTKPMQKVKAGVKPNVDNVNCKIIHKIDVRRKFY